MSSSAPQSPRVVDNPDARRFELEADGVLAGFAEYQSGEGRITFTHVETFPEFGGRGLGTLLVTSALDASRERGLEVIPLCPFVREVIARRPEYVDLVPRDHHRRFSLSSTAPGPN